MLIGVLGTVRASTKNIGFGRAITQKMYPIQLGSRKAKLRKAVRKSVEESLKVYAPTVANTLTKSIRAKAESTKKEIKGVKGKKVLAPVSEKRLIQMTGTNGARFIDLNTEVNKLSIAPEPTVLNAMTAAQSQHLSKRQADEAHSKATLQSMVNPEGSPEDGEEDDDIGSGPTQPMPPNPPSAPPVELDHSVPNMVTEMSAVPAPLKTVSVEVTELPANLVS